MLNETDLSNWREKITYQIDWWVMNLLEQQEIMIAKGTLALKIEWERFFCMDLLSSGMTNSTIHTMDRHWPLCIESPTNISLFPLSFSSSLFGSNLEPTCKNQGKWLKKKKKIMQELLNQLRTWAGNNHRVAIPTGGIPNRVAHFLYRKLASQDMGRLYHCTEAWWSYCKPTCRLTRCCTLPGRTQTSHRCQAY